MMADSVFDVLQNYNAANQGMDLTPQEQDLYKRHLSNLWGAGGADRPNGDRSSLLQLGVTGEDGRTYNVPSVWGGQILEPQAAFSNVDKMGWSSFPSYPTPDAAESRYQQMHGYMDKDTGAFMDVRRNPLSLFGSLSPFAPPAK